MLGIPWATRVIADASLTKSCALLPSATAQRVNAGTLDLSFAAPDIAHGWASPHDGKDWNPPLDPPAAGAADGLSGARAKRTGAPLGPHPPPPGERRTSATETNNHRKHGFNNLPAQDTNFNLWTKAKLSEFLSVSSHGELFVGPGARLIHLAVYQHE